MSAKLGSTSKLRLTIIVLLLFMVNLPSWLHASSKVTKINRVKIEITTHLGDKQTFVSGDKIKFLINLDQDSHLTVIYQDASGQLVQIIPHLGKKAFYKAGFFIDILENKSDFQFITQAPYGREYVWVFASDNANHSLLGTTLDNGFVILSSPLNEIWLKIKKNSKIQFGQARLVLNTRERI